MKLFDRFKKYEKVQEAPVRLENFPEMLHAKLLFIDKPVLDTDKIAAELTLYFSRVDTSISDKALLYFFPDIKIELQDATIPAQCSVFIPEEKNPGADIPEEAFQQNWHWKKANETAGKCRYEILVTDFMSRTLDYKTRVDLFTNFLTGVTKAVQPDVVYSINPQKLVEPVNLIEKWGGQEKENLFTIANVRLFNISNSAGKEVLMDTTGLSSLGLPDFQIRFTGLDESAVAALLWNYAYYVFDKGDIIESGHTLQGFEPGSQWRCERQISLAALERIVINVQPV